MKKPNCAEYLFFVLLGFFCLLNIALGQTSDTTFFLQSSKDILNTNYIKINGQHYYNNNLQYKYNCAPLSVVYNHKYSSYYSENTSNSIKDNLQIYNKLQYNINENIFTGINFKANYYSDDRDIGINKMYSYLPIINTGYINNNYVKFSTLEGYSVNKQINKEDKGIAYGFEANSPQSIYLDESNSSFFTYNLYQLFENISPRHLVQTNFLTDITYSDNNVLNNSLTTFYTRNKKDFYITTDTNISKTFSTLYNIQHRDEIYYGFRNNFNYTNEILFFDFLTEIYNRNITRNKKYYPKTISSINDFDTDIQEFKMSFEPSLKIKLENLQIQLRILYSERNEKHITENIEGASEIFYNNRIELDYQNNNISKRKQLLFSTVYKINDNNDIVLDFSNNKLEYNTPSDLNYDDREELLQICRFRYSHKFSQLFSMFLNIEGSYNHMVYMKLQKSINNNLIKILRLGTGSYLTTNNIHSYNYFEVSSNYTVYDYDSYMSVNPNFAFRQFTFQDTTSVDLGTRIAVNLSSTVKLSETGILDWDRFEISPQRLLFELYSLPRIIYKTAIYNFSVGFRLFISQRFQYLNKNYKMDFSYKSFAPQFDVYMHLAPKLIFKSQLYYEYIKITSSSMQNNMNYNIELNYEL